MTNKSQIPISNDQNRFGIWRFGAQNLRFSITPSLQHSITPANGRMRERPWKLALGLAEIGVVWTRFLYDGQPGGE
jgi:hypothetical protein